MNFYPAQLRAICHYIDALDEAEKRVMGLGTDLPYPEAIKLTDEGEMDFGKLVDEIGGAWSWVPPGGTV